MNQYIVYYLKWIFRKTRGGYYCITKKPIETLSKLDFIGKKIPAKKLGGGAYITFTMVPSNSDFFIDNIDRINVKDYRPTFEDYCHKLSNYTKNKIKCTYVL